MIKMNGLKDIKEDIQNIAEAMLSVLNIDVTIVDENLISENIAKNKTILGITGTFSDLDNFIDGSMVEITNDRTNIRKYAFY